MANTMLRREPSCSLGQKDTAWEDGTAVESGARPQVNVEAR